MWCQNSAVCSFVSSQRTRLMDAWTNGQNYDPQDRASIAALHGKNDIRFLSHPLGELGGVRGKVSTSSIACLKGCGQLPIHDNWTCIASSYSWDIMNIYWLKLVLFRDGGSLWLQILDERGHGPPTIVFVREPDCFCYLIVKTAWSYFHSSGYNTRTQQTDALDTTCCRS